MSLQREARQMAFPLVEDNKKLDDSEEMADPSSSLPIADISEYGPNEQEVSSKIRYHRRGTKMTSAHMKQFLRRIGLPYMAWFDWGGRQSASEFMAMNPGWTLRQWEELIVENQEIIKSYP